MAIGDSSGQLTLMEVSKLFSEKVNLINYSEAFDEIKLMEDILQNEIKRQEYMEMRYKTLDEEVTKPDFEDAFGTERSERDELEYKAIEESFGGGKSKILDELGIVIENIANN